MTVPNVEMLEEDLKSLADNLHDSVDFFKRMGNAHGESGNLRAKSYCQGEQAAHLAAARDVEKIIEKYFGA